MNPVALNPMEVLFSNLNHLQKNNPALAEKLEMLELSGRFTTEPSKKGPQTLLWNSDEGQKTTLLSQYDPVQEAARFVEKVPIKESSQFLVYGLGLGYHLLDLTRKANPKSKFIVLESQAEIFKLAMLCEHMEPLFKNPNIRWVVGNLQDEIGEVLADWLDGFALNGFSPLRFPSLANISPEFYSKQEKKLKEIIQESQVSQSTSRVLSKLLYQNCFDNLKRINGSYGIECLREIVKGTPVLIVAAGPSLDKNIQLIRGAQERCCIISVSTAFKPLLEAGIEPDFVVAIDPKPVSSLAFEGLTVPKKTRLVFTPVIPAEIVERFPRSSFITDTDLYLWKFFSNRFSLENHPGTATSVAHTALYLAQYIGGAPIILVGQDLSFSGERSHCSGAHHEETHNQNIGTNQTTIKLNQLKRFGTSSAAVVSQDIFGNTISTNRALDTFRLPFNKIIKEGSRLINATEGGINLPGMPSATLKEILANLSGDSETKSFNAERGNFNQEGISAQSLSRGKINNIEKQSFKFNRLSLSIKSWLSLFNLLKSKSEQANQSECKFETEVILEAESILSAIIQDEDTLNLLQEYLYSEFLDWNSETYKVDLLADESEKVIRKLERDRILFYAIQKAVDWFSNEIKSLELEK